jgi:hypothetical protein
VSQLLKVQCFNVTQDGFGAGINQRRERPFGDGADPEDLLGWAGATASWVNRTDPGGSRGLDDYFTRDFANNIGAEPLGNGIEIETVLDRRRTLSAAVDATRSNSQRSRAARETCGAAQEKSQQRNEGI